MKILVIGGGGREHALAWKLAQSPIVSQVICAPGNGGTLREKKITNHPANDIASWLNLATTTAIDLVVVGPEQPLAEGIVDALQDLDIRVIGPRKAAAQLESSKSFAKTMMQKANIPTAPFAIFTDAAAAKNYVCTHGVPIVIKADGLAAGKGVVVAQTLAQANAAIEDMMVNKVFGIAGETIIIEDCLTGEEASFIVLTDGEIVAPFNSAQDHKRLKDGDQGPNTGGMGAYVPAPIVTPAMREKILECVIHPLLRTLASTFPQDTKDPKKPLYAGFLYAGVMIDAQGNPNVLEFNCRLGDPETQPLLWGLDTDLAEVLWALTEKKINQNALIQSAGASIGIVLASGGYPQTVLKDKVIHGVDCASSTPNVKVFHAGTQQDQETLTVKGGRVLCVTARGDNLQQARDCAYAALANIQFEGMQYRQDIGFRALEK